MKNKTRAFAPATVANVAVGFDLLGFPIEGVGDTVDGLVEVVTGLHAGEAVVTSGTLFIDRAARRD